MGLLQTSRPESAIAQKSNASPMPDQTGRNSKIDYILQAVGHFASSYGLRPYRVLIISDAETKRKLQSADWNHRPLNSQSQLVVFAIDREISKERIDSYIAEIAGKKKVSAYSFLSYKKYLESNINHRDKEGKSWAAKQVSLAAGNLLGAAAQARVKATIVAEEEAIRLDELLGLTGKKLTTGLAVILDEIAGEAPRVSFSRVYQQKDLVEYI
ncbi:MAG: nitroreductase family protein [Puia sp.]|nr:nitroreductase family protein [Puia sp.]